MNYYDILGVSKDASDKEIRDAFNNMIKAFHPDMYRGSDKEFASRKTRELYEAFGVLKDPKKRREYDLHIGNDNSDKWNRDEPRNDKEDDKTSDKSFDEENDEDATSTTNYSDNEGSSDSGKAQDSTPTKEKPQQSEPPKRKGKIFIVLIVLAIFIVAGAYISGLFSHSSPYVGTYEYYKMEVRDSDDNLVDTQDAYSSDVYSSITLNNDGTATSVLQDDYAEGTWSLDRKDGEFAMINLNFTGDGSASAISYLALFNDNSSALYGFEDEGLNYLFYYAKK